MAQEIEPASSKSSALEELQKLRSRVNTEFSRKPPIAYSVDGQIFQFETPISAAVRTGSYVEISPGDGPTYFGQVMGQAIIERDGLEYGLTISPTGTFNISARNSAVFTDRVSMLLVKGHGILLGTITNGELIISGRAQRFQDAMMSEASPERVDQFFHNSRPKRAAIDIGTPLHGTRKSRVCLRGENFNRHTFLTGQSRSGKSFAMGVMLEQVLLVTKLRVVVIDPNSDFVKLRELRTLDRLNEVRPNTLTESDYPSLKRTYDSLADQICVLSGSNRADEMYKPLRVRFNELTNSEKPAVLRLDPLENREEFHSFQTILEGLPPGSYSVEDVSQVASRNFSEETRSVGLRIANLGIRRWDVWAKEDDVSIVEILKQKRRCTVVDIGALSSEEQKLMTAMVVLGYFWEARVAREPVLIIIDEAHTVAPAMPASELQRVCTDLIVRIAGEGLKYNIYMMIASQRPGKLNVNVMSQCDNQIIMRMMSRADLAAVAEAFSQIPESLVQECAKFELGNALIAGRVAPAPTFVQFDGRLSEEGGADTKVSWA